MKIYDFNTDTINDTGKSLVIALGNFDGVHIGHIELLKYAVGESKLKNLIPAVWTFERQMYSEVPFITTKNEKLKIFKDIGIKRVYFEDFESVRNLTPESFVDSILIKQLNCVKAVCGFNFKFGYGGKGDAKMLASLISCETIQPIKYEDSIVSSTRIRNLIESGDVECAGKLLGHSFDLTAPVIKGNRIGHKIGMPTINQLFPCGQVKPQNGVYFSLCKVKNSVYPCVTNIGTRPTVTGNSSDIVCETHIIGYSGDLYGDVLTVKFYKYTRGEIKFTSIEALKDAIKKDVGNSLEYFKNEKVI